MVIQANMAPKSIVAVWEETAVVFKKYKIPLTEQSLRTLVESDALSSLLEELNSVVGSTNLTCVEGG
ncbi:hypothetical protein M3181_08315 [Mesobacillus maritimus]|uniref:hypothetical protein n=1 Tax=Mesobacillus maritimus TaxID=1643336 RepID=UPI002040588A|nr:hypothetical protein [Mesobacillus maritimus]MCM3669004.1 hypothetical protein [Mesobacillus maritimus]